MHLYIIRHGEAKSAGEDPEKSLSEKGIKDVEKIGSFIEEHIFINVKRIYHSSKKRSFQTAEILETYIDPPDGLRISEQLDPMADPGFWEDEIKNHTDDLMIVGHLPHVERIASLLLFDTPEKDIINFQTAGLACLNRDDEGIWTLRWMITPEVLK